MNFNNNDFLENENKNYSYETLNKNLGQMGSIGAWLFFLIAVAFSIILV
jgi:hypothetical protein